MRLKKKTKFKSIIVNFNETIERCIKKLEKSSKKILLVEKNSKLIGVFQDSDLRRALVKKKNISADIITISNNKPKFIYKKNLEKTNIQRIFNKYSYLAIPIVDKNKRIVDVIFKTSSNDNLKENNEEIVGVVMAGGQGKRLRPITEKIPKPMAIYKNKPILYSILSNLLKNNIKNIFISVNYKKNKIFSYIKKIKFNCNIFFIEEKKFLGTVGSLFYLKNQKAKNLFVTNGDLLTNIDISNLNNYHKENKLDLTVVTKIVNFQIPYGSVETKNIYLKSLEEKPLVTKSIIIGAYLIKTKCLKLINGEKIDMPEFIHKCIKKKYKIGYYPIYEKYKHITSLKDLKN